MFVPKLRVKLAQGVGETVALLSHRIFPASICIQTTNQHNYQASVNSRKLNSVLQGDG